LNFTPLHWAAGNGHAGVVAILVEAGARRDVKAYNGLSPLELAVEKGHGDIARILEEPGDDAS
jgi:ankyrin repeat protein